MILIYAYVHIFYFMIHHIFISCAIGLSQFMECMLLELFQQMPRCGACFRRCDGGFRRYPKASLLLAIWALKVFVTLAARICVYF